AKSGWSQEMSMKGSKLRWTEASDRRRSVSSYSSVLADAVGATAVMVIPFVPGGSAGIVDSRSGCDRETSSIYLYLTLDTEGVFVKRCRVRPEPRGGRRRAVSPPPRRVPGRARGR